METQGEFFAGKLMDLANYAATALIFGQMVEGKIKWVPALIGFCLFFCCLVISFWLRKRE